MQIAPPRASECPLMYLVVLVKESVAPTSNGRCKSPVQKVLSTTTGIFSELAAAQIFDISNIFRRGLAPNRSQNYVAFLPLLMTLIKIIPDNYFSPQYLNVFHKKILSYHGSI